MHIFPAIEAMRLPCARLTDNEQGIVNKIVTLLREEIPKNVRHNGFEFETNNTSAAAMFEVVSMLEDEGWAVNCQPIQQQPRFQGASPTHVGYKLFCSPSKETREALKRQILE